MNKEILTVVDVVSNEKGVAKEIIFDALEAALASATKKRFEGDIDCRVAIDRGTGDYQAYRRWEVIDPAARPALDPLDEDYAEALAAEEKIADGELPYPERQIWLTDATARPRAQGGRFHRRAAGGRRVRPYRCPDRQAGHRAEGARGRARAGGRCLQGSRR